MDTETNVNVVNEKQFQVERSDDCCRVDFTETFSLTRDTHRSYSSENVSGNWSAEVTEIDLVGEDLKEELDNVCSVLHPIYLFIYNENHTKVHNIVHCIHLITVKPQAGG